MTESPDFFKRAIIGERPNIDELSGSTKFTDMLKTLHEQRDLIEQFLRNGIATAKMADRFNRNKTADEIRDRTGWIISVECADALSREGEAGMKRYQLELALQRLQQLGLKYASGMQDLAVDLYISQKEFDEEG